MRRSHETDELQKLFYNKDKYVRKVEAIEIRWTNGH